MQIARSPNMHATGAGTTLRPFLGPGLLPCRGLLCSLDRSGWRSAVQQHCCPAVRLPVRGLTCSAATPAATAAAVAEAPPEEVSERTAIGSPSWQQFAAAVTGEWEGVTVTFNPAGDDGAAEPQELPSRYVPNDFTCAILVPTPAFTRSRS